MSTMHLFGMINAHIRKKKDRHSQQTDRRTENQTPHSLTHKWMLNNENTWTQGGEHHTLGPVGGGGGLREG